MPLSSVAGQHVTLPLHGSKYFYERFDLSDKTEKDLLPVDVLAALNWGVHHVRISVMEAGGVANLKVNDSPAAVANGKILKNADLGASFIPGMHEIAMHITQLSAIQNGETGTTLEVEYWSGQA
jgi:hypothetical protein